MPKQGKVVAIDYGSVNVGIAISDPTRTVAFPRCTLKNDVSLFPELLKLFTEEVVTTVIVGLPYYTDHTEAEFAEVVHEFVNELRTQVQIPVILQDEKLTTFDALNKIAKAPARIANQDKDQVAAQVILEEFLNSQAD